mmetsp:Transcript_27609/g.90311  ORF Transcript_27609/g.90311 Transcript_27609/m.90311 type:complete len:227 (+) Transcript_27609:86-766(+)
MSTSELACTYASLILGDEGIPVTADKITAILDAAGVKVEGYWPGIFAKFLESKEIMDLVSNVGASGGGGGGGGVEDAGRAHPCGDGFAAPDRDARAPSQRHLQRTRRRLGERVDVRGFAVLDRVRERNAHLAQVLEFLHAEVESEGGALRDELNPELRREIGVNPGKVEGLLPSPVLAARLRVLGFLTHVPEAEDGFGSLRDADADGDPFLAQEVLGGVDGDAEAP